MLLLTAPIPSREGWALGVLRLGYADCGMVFRVPHLSAIHSTSKRGACVAGAKRNAEIQPMVYTYWDPNPSVQV